LAEKDMIVLERIARGAGSTNWYHVHGTDAVTALTRRLRPGSWVSFFFDNRIVRASYDEAARALLETWWRRDGDAVLLTLVPDDFELDYWTIAGREDLADLETDGDLKLGDEIYVGAYPSADNDGARAISLHLPDEDGIVRGHPH
jgi:hypothetical protein